MELRKLQATDLFSMVKILNGLGIKNIKNSIDFNKIKEAQKTVTEDNKEQVWSTVGTDIIMSVVGVIFENLPSVEKDLYTFMGGVANMKANDVAKMDISEFMNLLVSILQKEEFKDFFKQASKLIKLG